MTFKDLEIIEPILKAVQAQGYTSPTPIQEQSIPILLEGKDLLGSAQTGTGKTAAFAIPILQNLFKKKHHNKGARKIKALVVTPTRELALQISESFTAYGKYTDLRNTVVFGGVKQEQQTTALGKGIDILVATPGRLLDLMNQGFISLKHVEHIVLDEADQMLDMGFVHDIKKIISHLPEDRQSLFFSATMPLEIISLSRKLLKHDPEKIAIKPEQTTAERVEQAVCFVKKKEKIKLLAHLLQTVEYSSVLVFIRTKYGADKVVKALGRLDIEARAIHGNKSQNARQRALNEFKNGETKILIATDIAARGIDVSGLSIVINYDLPNIPETYVHRIGRTGRASASGVAISFCDVEERTYLRDIQKLIGQDLPVMKEHPFPDDGKEEAHKEPAKKKRYQKQTTSKKPQRRHKNSNSSNYRSKNKQSSSRRRR